jgi:hypothetical protein
MRYLYKTQNLMQHLFDNFSTIMKRIFHGVLDSHSLS